MIKCWTCRRHRWCLRQPANNPPTDLHSSGLQCISPSPVVTELELLGLNPSIVRDVCVCLGKRPGEACPAFPPATVRQLIAFRGCLFLRGRVARTYFECFTDLPALRPPGCPTVLTSSSLRRRIVKTPHQALNIRPYVPSPG